MPERRLPIGLAKEREMRRDTLPCVEVANEVLWVNPNFPELPLPLTVGKPSPLGRVLTPEKDPERRWYDAYEVEFLHRRAGVLVPRCIFKDKNGRMYREIECKGVGYVEYLDPEHTPRVGAIAPRYVENEAMGVLDQASACCERDMSLKLDRLGIRTTPIIAIIKLKELVVMDKNNYSAVHTMSIADARKKKIIPPGNDPVLELRAWKTHLRLQDVIIANPSKKQLYVNDARKLIAEELGRDEDQFHVRDYLEWLARECGKNLGILHKNNYAHMNLGAGHNTSLDGGLVDLDTVAYNTWGTIETKDVRDANDELNDFFIATHRASLHTMEDRTTFIRTFNAEYRNHRMKK